MRRILAIVSLLAAALLLLSSAGCANPKSSSGDYYRRGSIHRESFPPGYTPGRYRDYGYGRHGW
jgi:ABC-type oligopeptide transport system substrate-binding subunit